MVDHLVSEGTVIALEHLLSQAKDGQLIGVAFIGILRGRRPINGFAGYAGQDPLFAIGAIQRLNQELIEQAKERGY